MSTDILGGMVADTLAALGFPAASTAGSIGAVALQQLLGKRSKEGTRIFIEEMRLGHRLPEELPEDELASIVFRYSRAALEGTARLNLRLLAATACGHGSNEDLYAEEFLRWANLIADLRREEILLLGEIHRIKSSGRSFDVAAGIWMEALKILEEQHNIANEDADMIAAACLRTGLLQFRGGLRDIGHAYLPTSRLQKFMLLADVEGVMRRHEAENLDDVID